MLCVPLDILVYLLDDRQVMSRSSALKRQFNVYEYFYFLFYLLPKSLRLKEKQCASLKFLDYSDTDDIQKMVCAVHSKKSLD